MSTIKDRTVVWRAERGFQLIPYRQLLNLMTPKNDRGLPILPRDLVNLIYEYCHPIDKPTLVCSSDDEVLMLYDGHVANSLMLLQEMIDIAILCKHNLDKMQSHIALRGQLKVMDLSKSMSPLDLDYWNWSIRRICVFCTFEKVLCGCRFRPRKVNLSKVSSQFTAVTLSKPDSTSLSSSSPDAREARYAREVRDAREQWKKNQIDKIRKVVTSTTPPGKVIMDPVHQLQGEAHVIVRIVVPSEKERIRVGAELNRLFPKIVGVRPDDPHNIKFNTRLYHPFDRSTSILLLIVQANDPTPKVY